ncbi:MAG: SPOR domain-containing protein [Bacteroidota bacterium]|jgi:cell division septation protein DedD
MKYILKRNLSFALVLLLPVLNLISQSVKFSTNLPASVNAGETFGVDINISKGGLSSFAKFQMDLPAGYTATPIDVRGGSWTFDQQRAKIVWVAIPNDAQFTVKLKLTAPSANINSGTINSKLFYLENGVKQEFESPPHSIVIGNENINKETEKKEVVSNVVKEETVKNESKTNTIDKNVNEGESKEKKDESKKDNIEVNKPVEKNNSSNNSSDSKTVYRLQIGAFASKPDKAKYSKYKDFWYYEENGLYKVTIGKFSTLNDAEAYKAEMKSKGTDGFVVSFENNVHVKVH